MSPVLNIRPCKHLNIILLSTKQVGLDAWTVKAQRHLWITYGERCRLLKLRPQLASSFLLHHYEVGYFSLLWNSCWTPRSLFYLCRAQPTPYKLQGLTLNIPTIPKYISCHLTHA